MNLKIIQIDRVKDYKKWINLFKRADGATIFHNPDFLAYHGDRFNEEHLGIFKGDELISLIPLAIVQNSAKSPYGASYGGFINIKNFTYNRSKEIVTLFLEYLQRRGVKDITITPSLGIYYQNYNETFLFAMVEQGFRVINSDISSVVRLGSQPLFNAKLRNISKKAQKLGVEVRFRSSNIDDFWLLMEKTFAKHKKAPTHTKEEYKDLMQKFPKSIYCNIAYFNNIPIAGVGVFEINRRVVMSFYHSMDDNYKETQALTFLVKETILDADRRGFRYFDFGTSSVKMRANPNIFRFKENFGAIGLFRHTYSLKF